MLKQKCNVASLAQLYARDVCTHARAPFSFSTPQCLWQVASSATAIAMPQVLAQRTAALHQSLCSKSYSIAQRIQCGASVGEVTLKLHTYSYDKAHEYMRWGGAEA